MAIKTSTQKPLVGSVAADCFGIISNRNDNVSACVRACGHVNHAFRQTMKTSCCCCCCCCCCCRCMRACVRARACARVREREYACVSHTYVHVRLAARPRPSILAVVVRITGERGETVSSDTFSFRTTKSIETASTDSVSSKGTRTIRSVCQLLQRAVGTWRRAR